VSEYVALCLSSPGVVVTWFVTGFLGIGRPTVRMRCRFSLISPARTTSLRGRVGEGWQRARHDSICSFLPWSRNSCSWLKKDSWGSTLPTTANATFLIVPPGRLCVQVIASRLPWVVPFGIREFWPGKTSASAAPT